VHFVGAVENATLTGAANLSLTGNALANVLTGNAGSNILSGLAGNDRLTGGAGSDFFLFNTALNAAANVDTITDFSVPADTIRLENAVFTGLPTPGPLAATAFHVGPSATAPAQRIVYNNANGWLSYDADGNGAGAAVHFATLTAGLGLTAADFVVV
jgi:Ca2+-binding RTX toxin-like protein